MATHPVDHLQVICLALLWCEAPALHVQAAAAYVLNAGAAFCLALLLWCWLAPGGPATHRPGLGVALRLAGTALAHTSMQALLREAHETGAPSGDWAPAWLAATLVCSSGAWAAALVSEHGRRPHCVARLRSSCACQARALTSLPPPSTAYACRRWRSRSA